MPRDVLKLIANETYGESYMTHKIRLDVETDNASRIVGCCHRSQRKMFAENILTEIVLALSDVANYDGQKGFMTALTQKINATLSERKFKLQLSKILEYSTSQDGNRAEEFEDRAIAAIQDHMYQAEQNMVDNLVAKGKLNQRNFLVKDGSLEYRVPPKNFDDKRKLLRFKNNFGSVIGVSKKFNPAFHGDIKFVF